MTNIGKHNQKHPKFAIRKPKEMRITSAGLYTATLMVQFYRLRHLGMQ